ncbi:MAG: hypothetical protein AB199_02320 [Parcubacteria bacterium C7867-004]|nr:MAG: hypothetical protein AB199_02320 [Parcubacteria bacterium C7867-004]
MNIEDLSKTQLLLLTILVNFVTAIATAVMTVTLLDEAPPTVTQTVNRIVERTVETAAQATAPLPGIVTKETTVIIKDEDLLAAAISADASRTVLIYKGATTTPALAVGTFLPGARAIVTATVVGLPKEVRIAFPDGSTAEASLSKPGATLTVYGFSDTAVLPKVATPDLIKAAELKQGQTLVALTRDGSATTGIISKVTADNVYANVAGIPVGAAAVNISGDVIGIATASPGVFATADKILTLLSAAP